MKAQNNGCLKWPGSKIALLERLFETVPREGARLTEPFLGSASLALNTNYDEYILSDLNGDLIGFYKDLISTPDLLMQKALLLFSKNTKAEYYELRHHFNNGCHGIERSALFLYLNKHGFRGLVRYSKRTGFNVPYGHYKSPYFSEKEMVYFSEKFKNAKIIQSSFTDLLNEMEYRVGDVIYADPPYLPISKTSNFVNYTAEGFAIDLHTRLDELSSVAKNAGAKVFISNHSVPKINTIYKGHDVKNKFYAKRSISAKAKKHKKALEVLLSYIS